MNSDICTHLSPLEGYEGIQADNENLIVESSIFALFNLLSLCWLYLNVRSFGIPVFLDIACELAMKPNIADCACTE